MYIDIIIISYKSILYFDTCILYDTAIITTFEVLHEIQFEELRYEV